MLVITAILGTPALRNLSNGFLLNLAISDLLYVIISCPTTLAQVKSKRSSMIHEGILEHGNAQHIGCKRNAAKGFIIGLIKKFRTRPVRS